MVAQSAVKARLNLPFNANFDSAVFEAELADEIGVPVNSVRITTNTQFSIFRVFDVAIIDLTTAQQTEVAAFFANNPTFTLGSFGTVTTDSSGPIAKEPNHIVTLQIEEVCTSVSATDFPEAAYIAAFNNALASTASVTTSIPFGVVEDSPSCDDATPEGSTRVVTDIEVAAVDLGAVLALLPTASTTIDLDGDFGVVSLGNQLELSIQ